MKTKFHLSFILYIASIGAVIVGFLILLTFNFIGFSVQNKCQIAQEKYEGDCVEALSSYLNDETNPMKARNNAIWALGQMGDERALPLLESYYTGEECDHSDGKEMICQYELEKAMKLINGWNATAWVWRNWN